MPAIKCANGKWKWGESGSCKYDSKKQAQDANSDYRAETYNDYPESATNNAKRAIKYKEENGSDCGTAVGWTRARQLANRESLSRETIARMASFKRHQQHKDVPYDEGCGGIMWDCWGGTSGIEWAIKKLDEIDKEEKNINNIMEKRIYNIETRIDSTEEGKDIVVGHASIYNTRSEYMGFYETIEKDAFTKELIENSDVRALINHDQNLILARNTSGTLKLEADELGLRYEFEMPETSYGKDLAISMKRGDITQSSFAFTVEEDEWSTDDNGHDLRTIKKIKRLYDVSPVTYPAYKDANDLTIAQRGLAEYKETLEDNVKEEKDLVKRSLAKLKIELKKRK